MVSTASASIFTPVTSVPQLQGAALHARVDSLYQAQGKYFTSGRTRSLSAREDALRALLHAFESKEKLIFDALHADLHKGSVEAFLTEIAFVTGEIKHTLKHLGRWMKPETSLPPLMVAPARSYIHHQPLGRNLIISPWNYPVQLAFCPLVGALAAGNVAVIKPSELTPACSAICAEIVREAFSEDYVAIIEGGVEVSKALLSHRWDHIFFTGSTSVGRIIAKSGAEHLSRVTLELGGKSPAVVTASADIEVAARRIVMGKFVNCGQTCVAPDYVLVEPSVHDNLVASIKTAIHKFYGEDPKTSSDYGRIVNDRHFERLVKLIDTDKVVEGGGSDPASRYIEPTVMTEIGLDDEAMSDEIFGPILPIIRVESLDEAIRTIANFPNPLALYLFSQDREDERRVIEEVSFGGGCINNTIYHLADPNLPFGGVGQSGQGAYHGKYSFETFSHKKAVLKSSNMLDLSIKYPPFDGRLDLIRKISG